MEWTIISSTKFARRKKVQYLTSGNISDVDQRSLHRFHQYLLHVDESCGKILSIQPTPSHTVSSSYQQKELNICQDLRSTCRDKSPTWTHTWGKRTSLKFTDVFTFYKMLQNVWITQLFLTNELDFKYLIGITPDSLLLMLIWTKMVAVQEENEE